MSSYGSNNCQKMMLSSAEALKHRISIVSNFYEANYGFNDVPNTLITVNMLNCIALIVSLDCNIISTNPKSDPNLTLKLNKSL